MEGALTNVRTALALADMRKNLIEPFKIKSDEMTSFNIHCTVFPRISARALISYMASKTRHLNKNGRLFESRRLFLIAHFQGTMDLRRSLIVAHLRGR